MRIETLQYISNIIILIGAGMVAIGGFGTYFFGKKIEIEKDKLNEKQTVALNNKIDSLLIGNKNLSNQIEPFKQYAKKMYPRESESVALEKLKLEIEHTRKELNKEKETLSSLHSEISIVFSGNWSEKPYPNKIFSPVNNYFFLLLQSSDEQYKQIEFYGTEPYQFETIDDNKAVFKCRQAVKYGEFPLGENIRVLDNYNALNYFIPFILYENIKDSKIEILQSEISLFVNGKIIKKLSSSNKFIADIRLYHGKKDQAWASIQVKMSDASKNIIQEFK